MPDILLTLTNEDTTAILCPAWGGRFGRLTFRGRDILHAMPLEEGYDPENWPRGGAYPLIPFHNRIRAGRFSFDGADHLVDTHFSEPNTLHGPASRPAWSCERLSAGEALMTLDWTPDSRWPFAFAAAQHVVLDRAGLRMTLSVTNTGPGLMPAGLGWHPYFTKCADIAVSAGRDWTLDREYFPTGSWRAPEQSLPTRYLSDWRDLRLWLVNGVQVAILAEEVFSHLVIHDPAPAYSCVEPVSHLAGALNLLPDREADRMRVLHPGERLCGSLSLTLTV